MHFRLSQQSIETARNVLVYQQQPTTRSGLYSCFKQVTFACREAEAEATAVAAMTAAVIAAAASSPATGAARIATCTTSQRGRHASVADRQSDSCKATPIDLPLQEDQSTPESWQGLDIGYEDRAVRMSRVWDLP